MQTGEPFPVLRTERLALREIVPADAGDLYRFRSDPDVQRLNDGVMTQQSEAFDLIERMGAGYRGGTMLEWGVTIRAVGDTVVGLFGYANWSREHRRAEIGYCLSKEFWRQGIATEALAPILAFGFTRMNLNRIHACPRLENVASIRLLEKFGFQREGILREEFLVDGAFHDEALYAILHREYAF